MKKALLTLAVCVALSSAAAQNPSTKSVTRTSVLEEFSTAMCQYCPDGYQTIKKAIDSHPGTLWLVHHAGFVTDDITIPASERLTFLYMTNSFAPAYMIDRTIPAETYTEYSPVWPVTDSAHIAAQLDEMAAHECFASISLDNIHYDIPTRTVTGSVSGRVLQQFDTAITHISLYLVEDSIVMAQASTTGTIDDYIHMHAVRGCATDILGTLLTFNPDGTYTYPFNYTLPDKAVASHCRLVALLHYLKTTSMTKNKILNATSTPTYLTTHTASISTAAGSPRPFIQPNPATRHADIIAENGILSLRVTDISGRTLFTARPAGSPAYRIDTHSWPAGLYLVSITTQQGTLTERLIIQ